MSVKVYNLNLVEDLPKTIETDVHDVSLAEMIDHLAEEYGSDIRLSMIADGKLNEKAKVSIDGITVSDLSAKIPDGSQLIFYYLVLGG